jgi:cytochrome c peroxidase
MLNKLIVIVFAGISVMLFSFHEDQQVVEISIQIPKKWPKPHFDFKKSPITDEGFELGRKLFYDPILSRDNTISCASCHLQYTGFTHVDHSLSHGIDGKKGTRNSPVLINLAWNTSFHWDGGVNHLEVQGINPIEHPAEMDNTLEEVIKRLSASEVYPLLFQKAFGSKTITTSTLMKALTQFTVTLVSSNSKYDQVMRKEKGVEFTEQEKSGLKLFRTHCAACHTEPLFTNTFFTSNGLPIDTLLNDVGRYGITHVAKDSMQFKIPTLRNIEFTFPYMHDGRYKKLKDVINYYSDGINPNDRYLDQRLKEPLRFSEYQKKDLLAFLLTLTDKEFLYNKKFSYPKN